MKPNNRWIGRALLISVALSVSAFAQSTLLTSSGDWFDGDNWDDGVPTSEDTAVIGSDLSAIIAASGAEADLLVMGDLFGGGELTMVGGDLTLNALDLGGSSGAGMTNVITQTGGLITLNIGTDHANFNAAGNEDQTAIYNISGGTTLIVSGKNNNARLGENGTFILNLSGDGRLEWTGENFQPVFAYGDNSSTIINTSDNAYFTVQNASLGRYASYFEWNINGGTNRPNNANIGGDGGTAVVNVNAGVFTPNGLGLATRDGATVALNLTGGEVIVRQDLNVATGAGSTGTIRISGTEGSFSVSKHLRLGAGTTLHFELDENGAPTIVQTTAARDFILDGTLQLSLLDGVTEVPESVTLFSYVSDLYSGTFADVIWEDGLSGDLVYDEENKEVRLENLLLGERPTGPVIVDQLTTSQQGDISATFTSQDGVTYILEYTTSLTDDPVNWQTADGEQATQVGDGSEVTLQDDQPADAMRLYRIVTP